MTLKVISIYTFSAIALTQTSYYYYYLLFEGQKKILQSYIINLQGTYYAILLLIAKTLFIVLFRILLYKGQAYKLFYNIAKLYTNLPQNQDIQSIQCVYFNFL